MVAALSYKVYSSRHYNNSKKSAVETLEQQCLGGFIYNTAAVVTAVGVVQSSPDLLISCRLNHPLRGGLAHTKPRLLCACLTSCPTRNNDDARIARNLHPLREREREGEKKKPFYNRLLHLLKLV
jgi:hypothetical protein